MTTCYSCKENEQTTTTQPNLIDIRKVIPEIKLDICYARSDNFLGFPVYSKPYCFLHPTAAEALACVQKQANNQGLSLKVFDGYRPLSVQQKMWDLIQNELYVSNPAKNKGRHTRGTAVDVTLLDSRGQELQMPTLFDDFSEKCHSDYQELPAHVKENRQLLIRLMEEQGFINLPSEWWHFDFQGWNDDVKYPAYDFSFEELETLVGLYS